MILLLISARIGKYFVILQLEAEEDASSAEEQLASNRFLLHTEIVVWALSFGAAPIILGNATWLRKPISRQLQQACSMDCTNTSFARLLQHVPFPESYSLYSYVDVLYCRNVRYASVLPYSLL